jgi:branched-chain amino acid transport system permease protein
VAAVGGVARTADGRALLKDAAIGAGIAALLGAVIVGLHTVPRGGGLDIEPRWGELAGGVALVFLGRLALGLVRARRPRADALAAAGGLATAASGAVWPTDFLAVVAAGGGFLVALWALASMARRTSRAAVALDAARRLIARNSAGAGRWIAVAALAAALALPFLPGADRRLMDIAILVMTYVMLGWGLNVVVGLAGLLDLGYVAFYAVGAYTFALLALHLGLGFWECLPLAGLAAAAFGVALGFPVLRLRGDYLAIVTLGFGEMIRIVLTNWVGFTRGPNGISSIPRPDFFGLPFAAQPREGERTFSEFFGVAYSPMQRIVFLYYLILALALLTNFVTLRLRRLPLGRAWEALREDEIACRALGLNPVNIKLTAFAIGATFGGIAGAFFATRQGFISPESFTFIESAIILAIVVLGGMGSQLGVAVAAFVLIGIPEWFRDLQEYRMLAFGAAMVLIMVWRPRGLLEFRAPTIRLQRRGAASA